jgi:hypothetical protein
MSQALPFNEVEREAVYRVIAERRDVRRGSSMCHCGSTSSSAFLLLRTVPSQWD